ncbi:uncharacterized protein [Anabrus simplex]|uniref:uncharacterized protein isoform X2 n=1 Tax=Anabrus simplex TaxID=316456 RepID=UPI0035A2FE50
MDRWRSSSFDDYGNRFKRSGSFNSDGGMGMGPDNKRNRFGDLPFGMEPQPCEPIICIRNIPFGIPGDYVMGFLNHMMHYVGIAQAPGDPVLAYKMNMDMGIGLFKFRAMVEAREALNQLDGVPLKGQNLEMRPFVEDNVGNPPYPDYQDGYFRQQESRSQPPQFYGNDRRRKFGSGRMDKPPRRERGSQQSGLSRGGDSQESQMDPSRTLYVGNILRKASEIEVRKFLNEQMHSKGLARREGDPISLGSDLPNFYSFQVRSADEATKALTLHGAEFKTRKLVLRRPREYYTLQGKTDAVGGSHYDVTHRIYVGNIPPHTTEDELRVFLDQQMHEKELAKSEGDCILAGPMSKRQNFYFIEFRCTDEATQALALNGVEFKGQVLKIKRPVNYRAPGGKATRSSDEDGPDASWLLASWNIGDVSSSAKQSEIDHALFRMSIDVAAIQKTNLAGGTLNTAHYKWYLSGDEGDTTNGVAFLVHKKHEPSVSLWNPCGGRMASLHFNTSQQNITMITVLIPSSDDPEAATLMDKLEETVSGLPTEDHILLLGDFSAEVGKEDLSEEDGQWIGSSLLHANCNENGKRLKAMMHKYGLYLDTTRGSSTVVTLVTGKESSQVDHVLSNCKNLIKWIRSTSLGDHGTDHKVVRAAMRMTRCIEHPVEARDDEPEKPEESGEEPKSEEKGESEEKPEADEKPKAEDVEKNDETSGEKDEKKEETKDS